MSDPRTYQPGDRVRVTTAVQANGLRLWCGGAAGAVLEARGDGLYLVKLDGVSAKNLRFRGDQLEALAS